MSSIISSLHWRDIRDIAKSYSVKVSGKAGTTPARVFVLASFIYLTGFVWFRLTGWILNPKSQWVGFIALLLQMAGRGGLPAFFVNVPNYTCVATRSLIGGTIHGCTPGFWKNIKYPTEAHGPEHLISTQTDTLEGTTKCLTQDGVPVEIPWSVSIAPIPRMIGLYIRAANATLIKSLTEIVESTLTKLIRSMEADEVRKPDTTFELMSERLDDNLEKLRDRMDNTIEERFGIMVELSTIGTPEFDKEYIEAVKTRVLRAMIQADAKALAKAMSISEKDALNMIAVFNKESIEIKVNQHDFGDSVLKALGIIGLDLDKAIEMWKKAREGKGPGKPGPGKK